MTTATPSDQAAAQQSSAEVDLVVDIAQIIRDLDAAFDHFPEQTLRDCQKHRQLITPALIDVLNDVARVGQDGTVRDGNAPIYAVLLLAEFQAKEALPALFGFLTLPNKVPAELLGDAITEDLPRILAIFAADHDNLLDELIANTALNEYVRSAAIRAFEYLVRDKRIERSAAVARLRSHLAAMLTKENDKSDNDEYVTSCLVLSLVNINGCEAKDEIHEAYRRHLVDEWFVSKDDVDESLHPESPEDCPELDRLDPTQLTDTVEELRHWYWPADDQDDDVELEDATLFSRMLDRIADQLLPDLPIDDFDDDANEPLHRLPAIRHEAPRVGRNDPCPCGSGKKYKKCCLRKHSDE